MNNLTEEYIEFIGIYKNVYPDGFCKFIIDGMDDLIKYGAGTKRYEADGHGIAPRHQKDDTSLFFSEHPYLGESKELHDFKELGYGRFQDHDPISLYFEGLQNCYNRYSTKFSILQTFNIKSKAIKLQKTSVGEGYHIFHSEKSGDDDTIRRALTFILYLNTVDVEAGGETEFLYQSKRIKPVENTMIIFPADFTHVHRGNPLLLKPDKYIITGWFVHQ